MTGGVTAAFKTAVSSFIGRPQVYGFYLADEPSPSATTAANLRAESDWIHAHFPGAKTFMVELNSSGNLTPKYFYTPSNTHIDLFGLDPYPVQTNVPNHYDLNIIPLAVKEAEDIGIPQKDLVPVYQAFGGGRYPTYILPTATQEKENLAEWGTVLPTPAFDYAYSWGVQNGDTALSTDPALQQVFAVHNSAVTHVSATSVPTGAVNSAALTSGNGAASFNASFALNLHGAQSLADQELHAASVSRDPHALLQGGFGNFAALLASETNLGVGMAAIGTTHDVGRMLLDPKAAAFSGLAAQFASHR
jgi:hypothetical protein